MLKIKPDQKFQEPWYRYQRILSLVDQVFPVPQETNWLDLGCHQGQFIRLLLKKYPIQVTGIDNWNENLKHDEGWRYIQADIDKNFPVDEQFAAISALEVIEHMIDTDNFLENCNKHLRYDGILVLSTPNINSLRNRVIVPFGFYPVGLEYRNRIHHVRLYNVQTLKSHLGEHGFRVIHIEGVSFLPQGLIRYQWLRRLSEVAADQFPQLCNNVIVLCRKS